jgi:hypothetical protein
MHSQFICNILDKARKECAAFEADKSGLMVVEGELISCRWCARFVECSPSRNDRWN